MSQEANGGEFRVPTTEIASTLLCLAMTKEKALGIIEGECHCEHRLVGARQSIV